jgi:hypothetical protein
MGILLYLSEKNKIFPLAKEIFCRYFRDEIEFKNFFDLLTEKDKDKFLKISFFYYHHWWKFSPEIKNEIGMDTGLIIFISLIEAAVSEVDYKDFISWYNSEECSDKKKPVPELWEEYIQKYGAARKFIYFINNFVSKDEKNTLLTSFETWNEEKKKFILLSLNKIAKTLYQLRSNFVHKADYIPIPASRPPYNIYAGCLFSVKNKIFHCKITLDLLFNFFEKGIIAYFKTKIN